MIRKVQLSSTLDTAIISTGEVVIAPTAMLDMAPRTGSGAELNHIAMCEEGGQVPGLLFLFFSELPTGTWTVNADPIPSDADMGCFIGAVETDTNHWAIMGGVAWYDTDPLGKLMQAGTDNKIYVAVLARSQYDATAADDLNIVMTWSIDR